MPLTPAETEFLAAYVYEYMRLELGPASRKLMAQGLVYTDLLHLMDAYVRTHPLSTEKRVDDQGNEVEELVFGQRDIDPPNPPWRDRETAQRRNAEVLAERQIRR